MTRYTVQLLLPVASALLLSVALSSAAARAQNAYVVSQSNGVGLAPGTTQVPGTSCDDCVGGVSLPFDFTFYGQTFPKNTTIYASSNGVLQFSSANNDYGQFQVNFPLSQFNNAIFAHWGDLQTAGAGEGVFTSVSGTPGSQIFNIEWRASYFFEPPGTLDFEIRLYENQQRFDIVYGNVGGSGTSAPGRSVASPAVGSQRDFGSTYTAFCSALDLPAGGLRNGLALTFTGTDNAARFIAGRVTDTDGKPISGVTVTLAGDSNANALTDQNGRYSFDNLSGSNYTVAASQTTQQGASLFYPASRGFGAGSSLAFSGSQIVNFVRTPAPAAGDLLISEFRSRGPDGPADEFVELYNNTRATIVVNTSDGTSGWLVQAANQVGGSPLASYILPNGTVIPPRGHLLVGGSHYSSTFRYAPADDPFAENSDIPDDNGVAVFSTADPSKLNFGTRLDAVGFNNPSSPVDSLYREGAGLAPVGAYTSEHAFVRRMSLTGLPLNTGDNAADFVFVSTAGDAPGGAQSALGAPAPENLYTGTQSNSLVKASYVDPGCTGFPNASTDASSACGRVRLSSAVTNGANGTLLIRRRWTNRTNAPVTRLRFRIVDLTTLGNRAQADADLRVLSSTDSNVTDSQGQSVSLRGLTLENGSPSQSSNAGPPQPNGGGLNSSLRAGSITLSAPLGPGASINLEFRLGVQTVGNFRFLVNVEAQAGPAPPSAGGQSANSPKQTGGYAEPTAKSLPASVTKQ